MTHVATLITDPATPCLDTRHLREAAVLLPSALAPRWLAPGAAVEIPFAPPAGDDNCRCAEALRVAFGSQSIDVVVQAAAGRRKRLLVADMDSTLIEQESIDELADVLGLRERIAPITARSMRGEIAFAPALRERVALLRGLDIAAALRLLRTRITLTPGGRTLAQTMRRHGAVTAIVSGGLTQVAALVAETLGFDLYFANALIAADGALTGALQEPILDQEAKARLLVALRDDRSLDASETLAVGDGANDVAMMAAAGLGVAFRAKPAVAAAASARIDHGDLTALLYLQGYAASDFVTG